VPARFDWRLASNRQELVESILNVALFVPFGAALYANRRLLVTTTVLGFGLSLAVELLQRAVIPGREGELQDLIANSLGALSGWLLAHAVGGKPDA
jgi:glycopeptide antibiotics resistance protein